ncbi:MAG TPA: HAD hydrolase-like protein, partial [Beijerinckiaceae bacterium]|nr:HAD hydrolase-like protein [Beijerinckiaceae bacterium]
MILSSSPTAVFDLDGTLADTAPDLARALNHVLGELGRPGVPAESVRHLIGHGARALLRRGLAATGEASESLVERGYPLFLEYYGAHICDGTVAYEGLEEALDELAGAGAALAVSAGPAPVGVVAGPLRGLAATSSSPTGNRDSVGAAGPVCPVASTSARGIRSTSDGRGG